MRHRGRHDSLIRRRVTSIKFNVADAPVTECNSREMRWTLYQDRRANSMNHRRWHHQMHYATVVPIYWDWGRIRNAGHCFRSTLTRERLGKLQTYRLWGRPTTFAFWGRCLPSRPTRSLLSLSNQPTLFLPLSLPGSRLAC